MIMDVVRKDYKKQKRRKNLLLGVLVLGLGLGTTAVLARLEPALPSASRSSVWTDHVARGEMVRLVRGPGTLVPEEIRWVSSRSAGRIERLPLQPGVTVEPDTVLAVLSNPELELQALDAKFQLKAAEAQYTDLRVRLESQLLDQEAGAAQVKAQFEESKLQVEADEELSSQGLVPELQLKRSRLKVRELETRYEIEKKRVGITSESVQAQLAAQKARIEQLSALYKLRQEQVEALEVRAGISGVLQQVPMEEGRQVAPGEVLAKVAEPTRLKAVLRVAETQAKDVVIGQRVEIDTRNGKVEGRVSRVDPAVQNGTVTVDVLLSGALPVGARPDLSIDGTIEIERLVDVLYVGRPAYGQANSTVGLFRLSPDKQQAQRVPVQLGRSSVNTIEVVQGLQEGDEVILSDTSNFDGFDKIQLD